MAKKAAKRARRFTKSMMDALEVTEWGMKNFGGIITNRQLPLAVMRRCIDAGLCQCVGLGAVCDSDGFTIQPERYRDCYVLTDKGRQLLDESKQRNKESNP